MLLPTKGRQEGYRKHREAGLGEKVIHNPNNLEGDRLEFVKNIAKPSFNWKGGTKQKEKKYYDTCKPF